ncbi:hypothetical protein HK107_08340 [Parvularcula sp. ZS-1/3]|uniref:VPLPA-CTERM sorting domain-containing protein n=1 Tax=Parvularcula mediterranea TaxID=2732508 RepID=A0A7Y3W5A9_9PROT|nr:hypothetical protein [Parvularcula mediterranea]NNU16328.1 hypothetical protein [Parvularcula mediterranea]
MASPALAGTVVLYDQDFENPAGYVNSGGDVDIRADTINLNYSTPDFLFAQQFTTEILNITGSNRGGGTAAHGTGFKDPSGTGGNFSVGMLSSRQNDLVGLSFDVGDRDFLNIGIDISAVDLNNFGGPFQPAGGAQATFRFTLFDNPGGARNTGSGTVLSTVDATTTFSARDTFDWTRVVEGLSTAGNTNGNVTLQIDLLSGGYASFDNLRIAASDDDGDLGEIPLPAGAWLFLSGVALATRLKKKATA